MTSWRDRVVVMAYIDRLTETYNHLEIATEAILHAVTSPEERQRVGKALKRLAESRPAAYVTDVLHGSDDPQSDPDVDGVVECAGVRYQPSTGEYDIVNMARLDAYGLISYVSREELAAMLGVK